MLNFFFANEETTSWMVTCETQVAGELVIPMMGMTRSHDGNDTKVTNFQNQSGAPTRPKWRGLQKTMADCNILRKVASNRISTQRV